MTRSFDVIVFGATSFVGQILTRYLWQQYNGDEAPRWAIAGRSKSRLEALRSSLGEAASELPLIVADAGDDADMRALCEQTRVVISTVGPYALYGEPLIKACTDTGTDYCDLCGEVQWMRRMIRQYQDAAVASGARIVHSCGFDSIPSDMGAWYLQQQAAEAWAEPCHHVQMRVGAFKGGVSGGTVASMMNLAKEASADAALRRELTDPYSLCPPDHGFTERQTDLKGAYHDPDFEQWTAPFVMSSINTRVVHRSNALSGKAYGDHFCYDEAILTGRGIAGSSKALALAAATGSMMLGAAIGPTRRFLEKHVVPKPGEGPSERQQASGHYTMHFLGHGPGDQLLKVRVQGDRDPGYGSTAKILAQAGICLALDISRDLHPGGFWTPATVFGQALIDRLQQYAGVTFETVAD